MDSKKIFESIEKQAAIANAPAEGDYIGPDGLLYCHKCHTPKQCRVTFFDIVRTPYCLCKCEEEERWQREEKERQLKELERIRNLREIGFPDADMLRWRFERDDRSNERVSTAARNYVEHFREMREKGKGLMFYGPVGTGKTYMAACIANALIDRGYPCLMTNFARMVNIISGMHEGKQDYIDGLNNFALLVIDDLAAERDTEYMQEIVTNIIDARYRSGKPLIITTNLTAGELKNPAETRKKRVYSRLLEICIPIEVSGKDRRKERLKADYANMAKLLGLKEE